MDVEGDENQIIEAEMIELEKYIIQSKLLKISGDYLPRSIKKSYHYGVMGRVVELENIARYHQIIYQLFYLKNCHLRLKQYQAFTAISIAKFYNNEVKFVEIEKRILDAKSCFEHNVAIRDFLIEASRTFNYFRKFFPLQMNAINICEKDIFSEIEKIINAEIGFEGESILFGICKIIQNQREIMSASMFGELSEAFNYTFSSHPLFHESLIKFLFESDSRNVDDRVGVSKTVAYDL